MAKKILIDARLYGLEHTGIGRYLVNLIGRLKELETKEHFILLLRKGYFDKLSLPPNWKKVRVDIAHYSLLEQIVLPRVLAREKPDLVHFPHLNIPLFWRGKFVVTVHDLTMQRQGRSATKLPLPLYYLKRAPFLLIARQAVKQSVKVITPTDAVRKDVVNHYSVNEEKIVSIHEGLTPLSKNTGTVGVKVKKPYIFYVGNAYPHKNLKRLIEATKFLNEKMDVKEKVLLAIAGSRDYFAERFKREIGKMKAEEYVKLLGFVSDSDLYSLYKNATAFVYPSLSEGFGLQGLEAMAVGTLVLASDIPVFREVYKDSATYFNPYDFTTIAKAMKSALVTKDSERKKLIKSSQKFVQKYSWSKMAKQTYSVYKKALDSS